MNVLIQFIKDEDGLTAIEYVIAASLLVTGLTIVFTSFGQALQDKLLAIIDKIKTPV